MKMTVVESNPDTELLAQQTFYFSPNALARDNKLQIMTLSTPKGQGLNNT